MITKQKIIEFIKELFHLWTADYEDVLLEVEGLVEEYFPKIYKQIKK